MKVFDVTDTENGCGILNVLKEVHSNSRFGLAAVVVILIDWESD